MSCTTALLVMQCNSLRNGPASGSSGLQLAELRQEQEVPGRRPGCLYVYVYVCMYVGVSMYVCMNVCMYVCQSVWM